MHSFMRIGICCNNTAFSSMEVMPKFYSFGYGFPFFNSVSSSSWVPYVSALVALCPASLLAIWWDSCPKAERLYLTVQIQGSRTIMYGTKSHLGRNFGVLLAWMVAGWAGMFLFTGGLVRRNKRRAIHALPWKTLCTCTSWITKRPLKASCWPLIVNQNALIVLILISQLGTSNPLMRIVSGKRWTEHRGDCHQGREYGWRSITINKFPRLYKVMTVLVILEAHYTTITTNIQCTLSMINGQAS
jgi:hypothetical protein